jgi:hypothetical protein
MAGVAAGASRFLYAGRPDPRLEARLNAEHATAPHGAEAKVRSGR